MAVAPAWGQGLPRIGAQTRIDLANPLPGNETSIASSEFNPQHVVATWNDYREGTARLGVGLSLDGGATWSDFLIRPPAGFEANTEGDPMTGFDNRTGTMWAGAISFAANGGVFVARKDPGDAFFQSPVMAAITGSADKGWMAAGVDPNNANATRLYIAYNQGLLISTDMGNSWTGPFNLGAGLGFLPRVGPNGELYISYWDYTGAGTRIRLRRSFDGGSTLDSPITMAIRLDVWGVDGTRFPGAFRVAPLAHLAVDPNDGTLFGVYFDTTNIVGGNRNVDLYFTKSTDQGSNWTTPVVINTDASPPGDQFFPWIEVDRTGRLHLVFYDTRAVVQDDDVGTQAFVEALYAYSDDAGATWTEHVLTSAPFDTANDGFGGGFIGDYLGLAVGDRQAFPCYLSTQSGTSDVFVHAIENPLPGDVNKDGVVNLVDLDLMVSCIAGPNVFTPPPGCDAASFAASDQDVDLDVDLRDVAVFMASFGTSG